MSPAQLKRTGVMSSTRSSSGAPMQVDPGTYIQLNRNDSHLSFSRLGYRPLPVFLGAATRPALSRKPDVTDRVAAVIFAPLSIAFMIGAL